MTFDWSETREWLNVLVAIGALLIGVVEKTHGKKISRPGALPDILGVEITAIKEGGPSRDWLNLELGFLVSSRARAKVRSWFNAQISSENIARGREAVEKLLQREGRTAMRLEDLAAQLGFKSADGLFEVVGKDEYSLRNIEVLLKPPEPALTPDEIVLQRKSRGSRHPKGPSGVLVVGVDSLLTQLSRCCKPAPPDAISGFVTRGKGVSIHRQDCSNFRELNLRNPERVIDVRWGERKAGLVPSERNRTWLWDGTRPVRAVSNRSATAGNSCRDRVASWWEKLSRCASSWR